MTDTSTIDPKELNYDTNSKTNVISREGCSE